MNFLKRWWRHLSHDHRIVILTILAGLPGITLALAFLWTGPYSARMQWTVTVILTGAWGTTALAIRERVARPLQTLSNMLAALREGDFSIRARTLGPATDALSLAYFEVNALEEILREQRLGAVEATALLEKVLTEIDVAIFAFDENEELRLLNRAGERLLGQTSERVMGKSAEELRLRDGLYGIAPRTLEMAYPGGAGRWELRRSVVRQEGQPLKLLVLSDLSRALREEERQAWKRIIRVLSHEINNSLAPIKSIAASLHALLGRETQSRDWDEDLDRGLGVISDRSEALGRFMASYAQLARLPSPTLSSVDVGTWVRRVVDLQTRLRIDVRPGKELSLNADGDQLDQMLINLVRNAVDAALETGGGVSLYWKVRMGKLFLFVEDEGPGVEDSGNLFVPFFTTKKGGSGIGLVLSRQIAEGHGGSLTLENRRDRKGASARIIIPIDLESGDAE